MLHKDLAAYYKLDARTDGNRRVETDTLVDAVYRITIGDSLIIEKSLSGEGLTIDHSDADGDGFLFVTIANNELKYSGKMTHSLYTVDCEGNKYPVKLRPDFLMVEP